MNLIGPFSNNVAPVREGVYKVFTPRRSKANKYAYWSKTYGWLLCAESQMIAASEKKYGTEFARDSSMHIKGALWWGVSKDKYFDFTTNAKKVSNDNVSHVCIPCQRAARAERVAERARAALAARNAKRDKIKPRPDGRSGPWLLLEARWFGRAPRREAATAWQGGCGELRGAGHATRWVLDTLRTTTNTTEGLKTTCHDQNHQKSCSQHHTG